MKRIDESTRRKVNMAFDERLSVHHKFNLKIAKKHIQKKDVLDIGCWTGMVLDYIKLDAKSISGIDPGAEAIAIARKKLPDASLKVANAQKLPFKNNSFDTVLLFEVIEHVPANLEDTVIKEISRVMRKKGILIISTPNKHILSILGDPAFFLIGHRHYSMKYLIEMLQKNNFKIRNTYQTGGIARILTVNIELIMKHLLKYNEIKWPNFINQLVNYEYQKGGFFENHIIAEKLS